MRLLDILPCGRWGESCPVDLPVVEFFGARLPSPLICGICLVDDGLMMGYAAVCIVFSVLSPL